MGKGVKSSGVPECDPETKKYFSAMSQRIEEQLKVAGKARALGYDLGTGIESKPSANLGERCENIIGPPGLAERYAALYREEGSRDKVAFRLFEEIINEKWVKIPEREKRLEQALKTCLMIITEGVVVAPIDGVPSVKISRNFDNSEYVDIYFAGPIRAAGGTAQVFPLILGDYARHLMGLDRYKPTEEEVERYVEENQAYEDIVTRQYKLKPDEIRAIVRGCPVCVNGEPTEEREVAVCRDLKRIPSNRVRGGMCLVIGEGVALKARKILSFAKMLGLDWSWLENIIKVEKGEGRGEAQAGADFKYLSRIAAGRPIFSYPSKKFGFRLRYGRGRNTGIMAKAIHPATMFLLDEFPAIGTQLKVELPGKSAEVFPCDTIEGPIVKLDNDEVRKISSAEEAILLKERVKEIVYLGDYLCTVGDFRKTAHPLMPAGYCEEWWALELGKLKKEAKEKKVETAKFIKEPFDVGPYAAVELSMQLGVPLHPAYTFYYTSMDRALLAALINAARGCEKKFRGNKIVGAAFAMDKEVKKAMEEIGLPHRIENGNITVGEKYAYPLLKTLGTFSETAVPDKGTNLEALSEISGLVIRDKEGTFVGTRMGRPEAAKPREMQGNPHVLFPIGFAGGATRSINKAAEVASASRSGGISVEIKLYRCPKCGKDSELPVCSACGVRNEGMRKCPKCGITGKQMECSSCGAETKAFEKRSVAIAELLCNAAKKLSVNTPELIKGVRGLINEEKAAEPLEKGILRAKNGVHVFRDGTIRFDLINAPLTHFTPKETGVSVERLRELGYTKDIDGKELKEESQMLELFVQDLIVNVECGEFLLKVCSFIDELLERFYGTEPYYRFSKKEDLIGEIVLGLAPHTSAAVAARIIGFTKGRVNFAHPYFHLAKRRNADGDQDSIMLLLDCLLNFSLSYLPATRGGRMDAPLVFTTAINPQEIDDEVYEMETCTSLPLELYEKSLVHASAAVENVERVADRLGQKRQYRGLGFTHNTSAFDFGPATSQYVMLKTMEEKINRQAELQNKIRAVEKKDALERVLMSHFMPDIIGNARSFSRQGFRCSSCNTKYRRLPLSGRCRKCGKETLILTIAQGSVRKYLHIARDIVERYELSDYLKQRICLIEKEVESIFVSEKDEQKRLFEFL
jgi:DNA polymerase II large subunit